MSFNQSRGEKSESQQYRKTGRSRKSSNQRSSSGAAGGAGGGNPPPPQSSAGSSTLTANRSFKKPSNGQGGGQSRAPAWAIKQTNPPAPGSTRPVPKAPSSQTASEGFDFNIGSVDAPKSFQLQFGIISPGLVNVMQIPARTGSDPPNLDEQKRDQVQHDSFRAVPAIPTPSVSKHQPASKDSGNNKPSATGELHAAPSHAKRDVHPQVPSAAATTVTQKPLHPIPGISMPMPFQSQVPIPFGGPNAQIQSQGVPTTSLQMSMPLPVEGLSSVGGGLLVSFEDPLPDASVSVDSTHHPSEETSSAPINKTNLHSGGITSDMLDGSQHEPVDIQLNQECMGKVEEKSVWPGGTNQGGKSSGVPMEPRHSESSKGMEETGISTDLKESNITKESDSVADQKDETSVGRRSEVEKISDNLISSATSTNSFDIETTSSTCTHDEKTSNAVESTCSVDKASGPDVSLSSATPHHDSHPDSNADSDVSLKHEILSGPAQSLGPHVGMQRSNSDADRWQPATGYHKGLIPSPQTPLQVMHKAEKKYEIRKVSNIEAKYRQLQAILNKLTPQNFDKLFEQVKEVNIDNAVTLVMVVSQIFDTALMKPTFCEMYANICSHLAAELPDFSEDNEKITFKRILLNKCQEEFERGEREQAEANRVEDEGEIKCSNEEREAKRIQARRRMLGNIRLIGELYKKKMLTDRVMHECIKKLLGQSQNPDEEDIESLCKLMSTIGAMIDHPNAKEHMDAYFDIMTKFTNNMKLSSRVRFMLKDAIDLRKNKWQQQRKVEGPKKIEEVHRDAAQERQAQATRLARGPSMGSSTRWEMDFSPRGSSVLPSPNSQMGGIRGYPTQAHGYGQDVRMEERHPYESRTLSVPLSQRLLDDNSITLGPQGGLARGMSVRGQPLMSGVPLVDIPPGDPRRFAAGPNGYSSTSEWTPYPREEVPPRYSTKRFAAMPAYDQSNFQERQRRVAETINIGSQIQRLVNVGEGGSSHGSVGDRGVSGPLDPYFSSPSLTTEGTPSGPSIPVADLANATRQEVARCFYENGIPFNVIKSPSFLSMAAALGNFGRGLTMPTPYQVGGPMLEVEKKCIEKCIDEVKLSWENTGVTITSDGWKDIRGRQLINFLVNNPQGTVFLRTIDASNVIKTGQCLFEMLDAIVEEIGERLVVQVVTDNASNYVAAGKMLMEKRKTLYWTPCAAHCIDLMLEKIGDLPQHKTAIRKAKKVTKYIYNHGFVLAMMRTHVKKDLVRPAATRFGTAYLTLQSMYDLKQPLQSMFTSTDWSKSTYSKEAEGKKVKKIIMDDDHFWESVWYAIRTTQPLFKVLRMTDSEQMPSMGFLYVGLERAREEIMANLDNNVGDYKEIIDIIDDKWQKQLHRPLHIAGAMLNPHLNYDNAWEPPVRYRNTIYDVVAKMIPDESEQMKVDLQLNLFKKKEGFFGRALCKMTANKKSPTDWWESFGNDTPELQAFAMKVLSLTCSTSPCERNWSTFNQIHTKKRNRLSVEKMNSLAFVMYNSKLRERNRMCLPPLPKDPEVAEVEPLILEEVTSEDEWLAHSDEDEIPLGASPLEPQLESDTQGMDGESSRHGVPDRTYTRKKKTTPEASSSQHREKNVLARIEESESESDEENDDDSSDGGIDGIGSFIPNYQHLESDASMFN